MVQGGRTIKIRGARTHNLRAVDLDLPIGKITVITGVSGSGKSSLAFDTIVAEGQRRYLEGLSPAVRRRLDLLPRADVDQIVGLPPTASVGQYDRSLGRNPRATVATLTEIHDHFRLLFARCGVAHCPRCGRPLDCHSLQQIQQAVASLPEGTRFLILAPLVCSKPGEHREAFLLIRREGFVRARVDGTLTLVDGPLPLDPDQPHTIELVVDRQVMREGVADRVAESLKTALKLGSGVVVVTTDEEGEWVDRLYCTQPVCPACDVRLPDLEPRCFNFNSPHGACPACQGLGRSREFSWPLVAPDFSRSIAGGALAPWTDRSTKEWKNLWKDLQGWDGLPAGRLDAPLSQWTTDEVQALWEGIPGFCGLKARLEQLSQSIEEDDVDDVDLFRQAVVCPECAGSRLQSAARSVLLANQPIHVWTSKTIEDAHQDLLQWTPAADTEHVARAILRELIPRLEFLLRVGVGYVELDRPVGALSGGETQRIRLAGCVGSPLTGACYVLDEPSIGLHARDVDRLLDVLTDLRDRGNTVVVVEHDSRGMQRCDFIVDLGPGSGDEGGRIVQAADPKDFPQGPGLTADYLAGRRSIEDFLEKAEKRPAEAPEILTIEGAAEHNLKEINASIPLGRLVCVTGVSGSGKSSLIMDVLAPAIRRRLTGGGPPPGKHRKIYGGESLRRFVEIDQRPIGRSPRSTPATFAGLLEPIAAVFAATKAAKLRGFKAGRFSFNAPSGRCAECQGLGARKIDLGFLPDLYAPCPACRGRRYNRATLEIRYRDKSIADVLQTTVAEALTFFEAHPKLTGMLQMLDDVGLGGLRLDQWATTLSGGEAQRLKLASELAAAAGPTLYVLDEPTTGLHLHDVARLLTVLRRLVQRGDSVVVIEHHLDWIAASDWIIDLGPEGGSAGGRLVAEGPPEKVAASPSSVTGRELARRAREYAGGR